MPNIPRDPAWDSTLDLLRNGYEFVSLRCEALNSDVFAGRLMGKRTIFMRGAAAAELFADTELFSRAGAAPSRLQKTLFGVGGVQGLDGQAHRHRKALFMAMMGPERLRALGERFDQEWARALVRWSATPSVILFDEVEALLCRAVCGWAGVPLLDAEVPVRTRQLVWLIEGSIMVGPRYVRGRRARKEAERWAMALIEAARRAGGPVELALHRIAQHVDHLGAPLPAKIAAVELLNVLRPTVAIARYIAFAAVALHHHPGHARRIREGDDALIEPFVQEVRRLYPFFPMVVARSRRTIVWKGHRIPAAMRYTVPEQDLSVSLKRIPAEPKSRLRVSQVRAAERAAPAAESARRATAQQQRGERSAE